ASYQDPDRAQEYQRLIRAIQELTGEIDEANNKSQQGLAGRVAGSVSSAAGSVFSPQNSPAFKLQRMMQGNMVMRTGENAIEDALHGDPMASAGGIAGAIAGGALGLPFGGPVGASIGASAGGMLGRAVGSGIQGIANLGEEYVELEQRATDVAARFGDFSLTQRLADQAGTKYGYSRAESLSQIEQLRSSGAARSMEEATELLPAIQELSRALGTNAEAIVENTSALRRTETGKMSEERMRQYMRDVVNSAVEAGFETRKEEYQQTYTSFSQQAVQQSLDPIDRETRGKMLGTLETFLGGESELSRLLNNNPQLGQQVASQALELGTVQDRNSTRAAFLRQAGVEEDDLVSQFQTTEQKIENAKKMAAQFGERIARTTGMSEAEVAQKAQEDPNYIKEKIRENPLLQETVRKELEIQSTSGFQALSEFTAAASTGEEFAPSAIADTEENRGKLKQLSEEAGQTDAQKTRQVEAELKEQLVKLSEELSPIYTETREMVSKMSKEIQNLDFASIRSNMESMIDTVEAAFTGGKNGEGLVKKVTATANAVSTGIGEIKGDIKEVKSVALPLLDSIGNLLGSFGDSQVAKALGVEGDFSLPGTGDGKEKTWEEKQREELEKLQPQTDSNTGWGLTTNPLETKPSP
ncbi:MAG: hypothetical protein ABEJ72_01115, partial [Candidatus Aenigmatarchaeota archaeon]